ncbi:uncharacterized protein DFL_007147 [Arthrobotrys flagrans]|uniref:Uncharacterized protein n=1 Tax=Arthrobotrys flagrans TaxID=97331 RepID=A0A436ZV73_ARTFL|nr:hypothetical protein DFL_007147 [Arthrobotrys flagrans]
MPDQLLKDSLGIQTDPSGNSHNETLPTDAKSGGIILESQNYHEWSVSMRNLFKDKGWDQLIETPWHDGIKGDTSIYAACRVPVVVFHNPLNGELEPVHTCSAEKINEAGLRRECQAYILEHVNKHYHYFCDSMQDDPHILWKEIEEFWKLDDFDGRVIRRWYREVLERGNMKMDEPVDDYLERYKLYYETIHMYGGSMSGQEFIDCITHGLWQDEYRIVSEKWNTEYLRWQGLVPTGVDRPLGERLSELKEQLKLQEKSVLAARAERDRIWLVGWEREKKEKAEEERAEKEAAEKERAVKEGIGNLSLWGENPQSGEQGEGGPETPKDSSSDSSLEGNSPSISIYFSSP